MKLSIDNRNKILIKIVDHDSNFWKASGNRVAGSQMGVGIK
jgi:paraquat-inducible protein B